MKNLTLLYHEVIDDYNESGFQNKDNLAYMHKTDVFVEHVDIVKDIINKKNNDINYIFSFDDGGISNLKSAKILDERNFKGLYFITTKKINETGFLSKDDIIHLDKHHIIGSHSHTHPMIFRTLSYKRMLEEWQISKNILEEILQKEILYCSIPGGDADKKTYESAAEVGFKFIYDSEPIIEKRFVNDSEIFGRFSVKSSTTITDLENTLELKNLKSLQRNRKIKSTIKKIIFPIHQYMQNRKNE